MRAAIIITTVLATFAIPAIAQGVDQTVKVGSWEVRRLGGQYQSCVAFQTAGDDVSLAFGASTQDRTFVMLIDPTVKLETGKEYGLEYTVDTGKVYKTRARAADATTMLQVVGSVNDAAPLFTEVESGDKMHVKSNNVDYDFSLEGSKAALAQLQKCLMAAM